MHSLAVDPASHHKKAAPPEARDSASWLLLLGVWRVVLLTGASLLLCCLTLLLGWHLYLLTSNRTTIEYHEGVRACTSSAAKHHAFPHPYNLGLLGNVQEILGYFPGAWLLPSSCAVAGDGLAYPVSRPTLASLHGMGLPSRDLGGSVWVRCRACGEGSGTGRRHRPIQSPSNSSAMSGLPCLLRLAEMHSQ